MAMNFFDCNCSYGVGSRPPFRYAQNCAELLEEMDYCGIDLGLVFHTNQRFASPAVYNQQVIEDARSFPRLAPSWTILPSQTGEQSAPGDPSSPDLSAMAESPVAERRSWLRRVPPRLRRRLRRGEQRHPADCSSVLHFLNAMKLNGVKALRAFPEEHRYHLDSLTFSDLLETLVEKKVPLFVKANVSVIGDLLKDFPDLTVVVMNQGPHSFERYLRPLVEAYPNFYIETSYYIVEGLIEEFCEKYGPERLLFGSGFPDNCSGGAVLRLLHAEINDVAKQAIASGNLERLLKEVAI